MRLNKPGQVIVHPKLSGTWLIVAVNKVDADGSGETCAHQLVLRKWNEVKLCITWKCPEQRFYQNAFRKDMLLVTPRVIHDFNAQ